MNERWEDTGVDALISKVHPSQLRLMKDEAYASVHSLIKLKRYPHNYTAKVNRVVQNESKGVASYIGGKETCTCA